MISLGYWRGIVNVFMQGLVFVIYTFPLSGRFQEN